MTSTSTAVLITSVIHAIIVIINVISLCRLVAAGSDAVRCVPSCTCRQKNPSSALTMNCSGVVDFPLTHLNIVNLSSSVAELDLSNNSIASVPTSSFHIFVRLQILVVRWNRLAVIEPNAFRGTLICRLDLSGNSLAAIRPRTFAGVEPTLVELDLSSNSLVSIDDAFVGLSALSRLDLRHNLLASLTATSLRGLYSLRHLRLDDNLIAEVDQLSLHDLSRLMNVALRDNRLTGVTRLNFPHNASLTYIDLSECSLTTVPRGVPDTVTYIQLRRNNITRLNDDSFVGASRVKILVLDENEISEVDDGTFRYMKNLSQLWLNNNQLVRVPAGLPSSIERLMLDSNNIDRLSADSFAGLSRLSSLTMMENVITEIAVGAFRPLSRLTHLDLSANDIVSLSSGLFGSNANTKTLLLSRNPLRSLNAGSFDGLAQLTTLSLSFVQRRVCVDEDAFKPLTQLVELHLDNSPWLAARITSSSRLARALTSLRHLSLQRTELAHLRLSFFSAFSEKNIESVRLSGSGWVCDEDLVWLRGWLMTSPLASDVDRQLNRCSEPPPVARRLIVSLAGHEFNLSSARQPTRPRTGSSKILRENVDSGCDERPRTTSGVVAVTGTPRPSGSQWRRGRRPTSMSTVTSQPRHSDVNLVQVFLVVCTLVVTLALSSVIIAVIVRLSSRRRHGDDHVTSGPKSLGHVTGSRVSVRHCPAEDTAAVADGWRSRSSSLSRGGRTTDYRRPVGGGQEAVCNDANDRLVNKVDVERLFANGGGTRLTDEQWRVYTWEDT